MNALDLIRQEIQDVGYECSAVNDECCAIYKRGKLQCLMRFKEKSQDVISIINCTVPGLPEVAYSLADPQSIRDLLLFLEAC